MWGVWGVWGVWSGWKVWGVWEAWGGLGVRILSTQNTNVYKLFGQKSCHFFPPIKVKAFICEDFESSSVSPNFLRYFCRTYAETGLIDEISSFERQKSGQ